MQSEVTAVEENDGDIEGIEDSEGSHEGAIVAARDNDMSGRPDSEEAAAEEDMQME